MIAALQPALAAIPILLILVLMIWARWSAARAGTAGLIVTLLLAGTAFEWYPELGFVRAAGGAMLEAVFVAVTILWIIFSALCLHHLQVRVGAIETLRDTIGSISSDRRIVAILVAWFFALFIEGAAGFGTPVALAAPFLVSFGFRPVEAVTLALIGHSVGVSFGAVGTPILPQIAATGLSGLELSRAVGLFHSLFGWVLLMVVLRIAWGDAPVARSGWPWGIVAAAAFFVPYAAIAHWVGPELPTLGGALLGGALFIGLLRLARSRASGEDTAPAGVAPDRRRIFRAAAPYLALVGLILVTRLIPPLKAAISAPVVEWAWSGHFQGTFQPLYHPGTMLFLGFLSAGLFHRAAGAELVGSMKTAARQVVPVLAALVAMLGLSRLMVHASMIDSLARMAAATVGGAWPALSPFVGVLGTFMTGSATASNILLTDFQQATARSLELPVLTIAGAQCFGAAVGNIICPHNIIAGGATVGVSGQEGEILRGTLWVGLLYAALGGMLALALV